MIEHINDLSIQGKKFPSLFLVYEVKESGTSLIKVTKNKSKLKEYDNSPYFIIYKINYIGKLVIVGKLSIPFKSFIEQQLLHFNRDISLNFNQPMILEM